MGARSTLRTDSGETLELKEGIVLDRDGRQLTSESPRERRFQYEFEPEKPQSMRSSLIAGNSLWVLILAFFTPVLVIASFLAFGSLAAILGIAFLGFTIIRGITRLFN